MNSQLKLFFFSPILTNNNLLFKIYCEILWKYCCKISQLGFFFSLYYFLFFHFILLHTCVLYPPSFISFSPQETSSNIIHSSHHKERERERERDWLGPPLLLSISTAARRPPHQSACSFFFFFFSYLLVLIQLYFKNWILYFVLCFVFGLILLLIKRSIFFLFSFFFSFFFLISFGLWGKKKQRQRREW